MKPLLIAALTLLLIPPAAGPQAKDCCEKVAGKIQVWVNKESGVYHCPGTRWYCQTKRGQCMEECAARKAGYQPANRKPCGSVCE
jgi:hypothetical protein